MKKIAIIFVTLLLLGGGTAYYFIFMPEGYIKAILEGKSMPQSLETVALEDISIPVIRKGGVAKYVLIQMLLELNPETSVEHVLSFKPHIRDSCLRELHEYFSMVSIDGPINIRSVKRRLLNATHRIVGKEAVRSILITGIYEKKSDRGTP